MRLSQFEVQLPGRPKTVIPAWGNLPNELMAALAGVKPVVHAWIDSAELSRIEAMADALGLKLLVYSKGGPGSGASRVGVMIGADMKRLRACAEIWDKPMNNPGEHLGYPPCCVKAFWDWNPNFDRRPEKDCILVQLEKTKKRPLPWLLNDVYYMYSRPWSQQDVERRESIARANPGWPIDLMNVNAWHPCSYECKESLAKAKKTWAMIKKHLPELAKLLEPALKRPVIFWDWHRFAALDGKSLAVPTTLLEAELAAAALASKDVSQLPGRPVRLVFG